MALFSENIPQSQFWVPPKYATGMQKFWMRILGYNAAGEKTGWGKALDNLSPFGGAGRNRIVNRIADNSNATTASENVDDGLQESLGIMKRNFGIIKGVAGAVTGNPAMIKGGITDVVQGTAAQVAAPGVNTDDDKNKSYYMSYFKGGAVATIGKRPVKIYMAGDHTEDIEMIDKSTGNKVGEMRYGERIFDQKANGIIERKAVKAVKTGKYDELGKFVAEELATHPDAQEVFRKGGPVRKKRASKWVNKPLFYNPEHDDTSIMMARGGGKIKKKRVRPSQVMRYKDGGKPVDYKIKEKIFNKFHSDNKLNTLVKKYVANPKSVTAPEYEYIFEAFQEEGMTPTEFPLKDLVAGKTPNSMQFVPTTGAGTSGIDQKARVEYAKTKGANPQFDKKAMEEFEKGNYEVDRPQDISTATSNEVYGQKKFDFWQGVANGKKKLWTPPGITPDDVKNSYNAVNGVPSGTKQSNSGTKPANSGTNGPSSGITFQDPNYNKGGMESLTNPAEYEKYKSFVDKLPDGKVLEMFTNMSEKTPLSNKYREFVKNGNVEALKKFMTDGKIGLAHRIGFTEYQNSGGDASQGTETPIVPAGLSTGTAGTIGKNALDGLKPADFGKVGANGGDGGAGGDVTDHVGKVGDYLDYAFNAGKAMIGAFGASKPLPTWEVPQKWKEYVATNEELSKQGFTSEEKTVLQGNLDRNRSSATEAIRQTVGGGGSSGAVLAALDGVNRNTQLAQNDLTMKDASMRRANLGTYGNVLSADLGIDRMQFEDEYNAAAASKQAFGQLAASGVQGMIDKNQFDQTYGPGTNFDQLQKAIIEEQKLANGALKANNTATIGAIVPGPTSKAAWESLDAATKEQLMKNPIFDPFWKTKL